MLNGSDFKWHSKTKQPKHSKSDQIATILESKCWFCFWMVGTRTIAIAMVPIIPIPNLPNLNTKMFGFQMGSEFKCLVFKWLLPETRLTTDYSRDLYNSPPNNENIWTTGFKLVLYSNARLSSPIQTTTWIAGNICHHPAISTVFPINRILYLISIGSILNIRSPVLRNFDPKRIKI